MLFVYYNSGIWEGNNKWFYLVLLYLHQIAFWNMFLCALYFLIINIQVSVSSRMIISVLQSSGVLSSFTSSF